MADEEWGPPFKVDSSEVTFESNGVTIAATLLERERLPVEPPAEGKKPKKIKEGDPEAPPRAWCILVHGLLSDRNEFGDLPMALAREGYGVLALDMPGHGISGGDRGIYDAETAVQVVKDAQAFLRSREEQWDLKPQQWGIIGHSTGSIVAMKMGHYLHAGDIIVAAAPLRTFAEEMNPIKRAGYAFLYATRGGRNGKGPGPTVKYPVTYKDIFADRQAMADARSKGFLQTRIPINNYPLLMKVNGEDLARGVMDPTVLFIVGEKDKVIAQRASHTVYDACGSAKTWHVVKGSGHSMFMDGKRDEAIRFVVDWTKYRLSAFNEVRAGHTKR